MKLKILTRIGLTIIAGSLLLSCQRTNLPHQPLSAYFSYTRDELGRLKSMGSSRKISLEDLFFWEEMAYELVAKHKISSTMASKVYATLMVAQRDAAFLSYNIHGKFMGSLDGISNDVLCEFFPTDCLKISRGREKIDAYSEGLTRRVMAKVMTRIAEERKQTKSYPRKEGDEFWISRGVAKGKSAGSWKTWIIPSVNPFRLPPPPSDDSPEDRKQLQKVRSAYDHLTAIQKRAVVRWAAGPGTRRTAGLWFKMASDAMRTPPFDLKEALMIRSIIAMGIADVYIATSDNIYTYWVRRPFMRDSSIQTYMPTPNHPSYPSSSSAIASFSASMFCHYFPEQSEQWKAMTEESKNSRIWSGIHFPMDVEQGSLLGERIAEAIMHQSGITKL